MNVDVQVSMVLLLIIGLVFAVYFYGLWRVARVREERDLYLALYSGFLCHFLVWGFAEGYLITGFWFMMGLSYVNVVDVVYWFMAWCLAVVPLVVTVVFLAYYFVYGFRESVKRVARGSLLSGDWASFLVEWWLGVERSKFGFILRVLLSVFAGWGAGNIVQDRVSGAISVLFSRVEYKLPLMAMYLTFMGDPVGALVKWILPIVVLNLVFFWMLVERC